MGSLISVVASSFIAVSGTCPMVMTKTSSMPPLGFTVLVVPHIPLADVLVFTMLPSANARSSISSTPLLLTLGRIPPHAPFLPVAFCR